jgi:hypothetical protein
MKKYDALLSQNMNASKIVESALPQLISIQKNEAQVIKKYVPQ